MTALDPKPAGQAPVALRSPDEVMRLARLGSMHLSRLSFSRSLIRTVRARGWTVTRSVWEMDAAGYGHAVYRVDMAGVVCSLVAFSHYLPPESRIDRVIAAAWDTTYVLYDGMPDAAALARLQATVPRQEASRYSPRELILARANRSVRVFDETVAALASGRQPDHGMIREIGYILRTTAVYGNGKFGIADRNRVVAIPGLEGAFAAEMLTVWLIRAFSVDLVEHCARRASPAKAVPVDPRIRRDIGVGNSTGLGMAPFLVRHPALLHSWIAARETALMRVRALPGFEPADRARLSRITGIAREKAGFWQSSDEGQQVRIIGLRDDLDRFSGWIADSPCPDALFRRALAGLAVEAVELVISLLIDAFGALSDDLVPSMAVDEGLVAQIDGATTCGQLLDAIDARFSWATEMDFLQDDATARFWYTSQEKLEPRLGWRGDDEGEALELPLGVAREVHRLAQHLHTLPAATPLRNVLRDAPDLRYALRRVQIAADYPYGEIRDNILAADHRPRDIMRCKLSFLGCEFYDPSSDLGLKVRFFQGAPYPDNPAAEAGDGLW